MGGLADRPLHPVPDRVLELARKNAERAPPHYRSILLHWLGRRLRRMARVEPGEVPPVERGQVAVTFGGHATALVRYHSLAILCDPMLGRSLHGLRRAVAPGLDPAALTEVDLVLVSHAAGDRLHLPTLARIPRTATVVVPPRAAALVSPLGFARLVELSAGTSVDHRGVEIWAEPVQHGDPAAPALSYVLRPPGDEGPAVYFCGASGYFGGFSDIGRRHRPDVALLPIAGYWPRSLRRHHMSPLDALYAFEDLRARVMIPIAFGSFALSYEKLDDPARWLGELVDERGLGRYVVALQPGESRLFVPSGAGAGATRAPTVSPEAEAARPSVTPDLDADTGAVGMTPPPLDLDREAREPGEGDGDPDGTGQIDTASTIIDTSARATG